MKEIYIYWKQKIRIIVFSSFWLSLINDSRRSEVWWFYGSVCLFSVFFKSFRLVWFGNKGKFFNLFQKGVYKISLLFTFNYSIIFYRKTFSFMHLVLICFSLEVDFCLSRVIHGLLFLNFSFCFKKSRGILM